MTFMVDDPLLASHKSYEILYDTQDMPIGCNFDYVKQEVIVEDFRALKGDLSMDRDGFLLEDLEASMTYEDFFNEDVLKERYVSDVKRTIQELCGARAVYIHECVFRKRGKKEEGYGVPIRRVHGDYTTAEANKIVQQICGERADSVRKRRFQMLNVWKPLVGPLMDWPLALCNLSSIDEKDMKPVDVKYPSHTLESYRLCYNPNQRWGYFSKQEVNEILIFKSADSVVQGTVPHCSFDNPECPKGERPRESIELRALVVY